MEWRDVETLFTEHLLAIGRTPATADSYVRNARFFWRTLEADPSFAGESPADATDADLNAWIAARRPQVSANKLYVDHWAIRTFYAWLKTSGFRADDPAAHLRVKREVLAPEPPYSDDEVRRMYAAANRERDRLVLRFLETTGVRINELCTLDAAWIDFDRGLLRVLGKGQKQRLLAPPPDLITDLRVFLKGRTQGPLFYSRMGNPLTPKQIRQNLEAIARRAGVGGVHPHRFRTNFAVRTLRAAGGDMQAVQELLGHARIETTQRYTAFDKAQRALEIMKKGAGLFPVQPLATLALACLHPAVSPFW